MFRHILVPTDGSPLANNAVRRAIQLAREQKARVTVLHVAHPYNSRMAHYVSRRVHEENVRAEAKRHFNVAEQAAATAGVRCDSLLAFNDFPFEEIIRTAGRRKCDLICMASHGRRGISRLLLGSETSKVLAHSRVPVLVVR